MKHIEVLVVDDEEDVYLSTKLALQLLEYEGIDVNVSYSDSAKAAIEMIGQNKYKLIFLDVIMETVNAGYKVIDYINKNHTDDMISIFIRSGQPGNVPEEYLSLIENIDGYISKTDCTMDKLHDIVKALA
ncbi:response regulator [Acidaminobacter sp. JC074]|uniref:response regulator n=1 Tax=Acidaminobacter sp. JC074 TaxID=2530199 RepID=UPI001F114DA4|nr:response regulator [Acidaminobacter sp. JC074]MCH4887061.1 response regulator [Acidaminobacter sp. JC074]